jgi:predicted PurR-regulated permease PerM
MTPRAPRQGSRGPDHGPVPASAVVPPADRPLGPPLAPEHLYKAVGLLFILALLFRYFEELSHVFLVIYAAAILAVALNVIVRLFPLERRWVTAGMGLLIVSLLGLGLWWAVPALMKQVQGFVSEAPRF